MLCVFSAWKISGWFYSNRSEFGRLKDRFKKLPSGSAAPAELKGRALWRWGTFMYLWDHIVGKKKGDDTMVGISFELRSFYFSAY